MSPSEPHGAHAASTAAAAHASSPGHVDATITDAKLTKYFAITGEALVKARAALDSSTPQRAAQAADFLDMAQRYYDDAHFFRSKNDFVNAFAALNYAHGWLDAGARIRLFAVNDSRLFTVDGPAGE